VPVTVVLIPNHEQITRGAAFQFQDELRRRVTNAASTSATSAAVPRRGRQAGLFIPTSIFRPRQPLLLGAIQAHLGDSGTPRRHGGERGRELHRRPFLICSSHLRAGCWCAAGSAWRSRCW